MKNARLSGIKKILVINFGGIGDLLLSTPALRALKNAYPDAELYVLVTRSVASAAAGLGYSDKIFCLEVSRPWIYGWYNLSVLLNLRKERIDLAVNMRTMGSTKSALKMRLVFAFIRPKLKAGRNTAGRGAFFDISIPEESVGTTYEMEYDIAIAEALGAAVSNRTVDFCVSQQDREDLKRLLLPTGIRDSDVLVGIHPGGRPSRRWPAENFAAVLQEISRQKSCVIVMTGNSSERDLCEKIIRKSNAAAVNLAGRLDLRLLGALIERCNLYISNDTGPMHIAAILKRPLVAILGPGCLSRYNPAALAPEAVVLYKPACCSPCNKYSCASLACLRSITVAEVAESALKLLP